MNDDCIDLDEEFGEPSHCMVCDMYVIQYHHDEFYVCKECFEESE
jgi:hypothetical protein